MWGGFVVYDFLCWRLEHIHFVFVTTFEARSIHASQGGQRHLEMECERAARHGDIAALKAARAAGEDWGSVCAQAARAGHLHVLRWARKNGAPWDVFTCAFAAFKGHTGVLRWAHKHGAPWDEWTCAYLAACGMSRVLSWARRRGAPWDDRTCVEAIMAGHTNTLRWALAHGAPTSESLTRAAATRTLPVLKMVVACGAPVTERAIADALRACNTTCALWLYTQTDVRVRLPALVRKLPRHAHKNYKQRFLPALYKQQRAMTCLSRIWKSRQLKRKSAVCVIEDAWLMFAFRPKDGPAYQRTAAAWNVHVSM